MSTISVDYDVLNQRGSPAWFTDTFANIPTAGFKGRMFISTDTFAFYRDTGTGWDLIGGPGIGTLTGSGVVGQVSFFNGTQVLAGNNNLFWDNTNSRLGINTTTPGAPLDIHATGTNAQFNGTGTNNATLVFQNAGSSKWTIGNSYSGGSNLFQIYNNGLVTAAITINSATNLITNNSATFFDNGVLYKDNVLANTIYAGYVSACYNVISNDTYLILSSSATSPNYYQYLFPKASGTLTLTSDLSGYVNLTTNQTIGGTKSFTNIVKSESGVIILNGVSPTSSGYTGIGSSASGLTINLSAGGGGSLLFQSSSFSYTFPAATGTLALTSDLSSYLPLAGGTLTGALVINPTNTLTIGLDVASNTIRFRSDNLEGFKRQLEITMGSGTLVQLVAKGYLANYGTDMAFYTATTGGVNASPGIYITGTNNRVGISTGTPIYKFQVVNSSDGFISRFTGGSSSDVNIGLFGSTAGSFGSIGTESNHALNFFTNGTDRISINPDGNIVQRGGTSYQFYKDASPSYAFAMGYSTPATALSNDFTFANYNGSSWSERMRIASGGNVLIGTSSSIYGTAGKLEILYAGSSTVGINMKTSTSDGLMMNFLNSSGTQVGYIYSTTTTTQYATTSDYRLKEDFKDSKGLEKVSAIKIYDFKYKNSENRMDGVVAHELQEIIPYAVVGEKDGERMQGVDYSLIVPTLVKAIQELNEKLIRNNIN